MNKRPMLFQESSVTASKGHSHIIQHLKTRFKGIQKTVFPGAGNTACHCETNISSGFLSYCRTVEKIPCV